MSGDTPVAETGTRTRVFVCFPADEAAHVKGLLQPLRRQPGLEFCVTEDRATLTDWRDYVGSELTLCDALVVFIGARLGESQRTEVALFATAVHGSMVVVLLSGATSAPLPAHLDGKPRVSEIPGDSEETARQVGAALGLEAWQTADGLPIGYPFDYEKAIIKDYVDGGGKLRREHAFRGCAWQWPTVDLHRPRQTPNPAERAEIGRFRPEDDRILPDARLKELRLADGELWQSPPASITFLEAGPREWLRNWGERLKVGIVVSGGIAPGINAVIDGIVTRHQSYQVWDRRKVPVEIFGFPQGFRALLHGGIEPLRLHEAVVKRKAEEGGALIATSRADELLDPDTTKRRAVLDRLLHNIHTRLIKILYVIGGDGSMRCAHALQMLAKEKQVDLAVVAIPKTMDNDILWVWQSFGFLSAVEKAREAILNLHTEVQSNPRLGIIQLFGSDSGFVASHAAYSAACDLVLIPEDPLTMEQICSHLCKRLVNRYFQESVSPHALAVMAETALPADAQDWYRYRWLRLDPSEVNEVQKFLRTQRVHGQTPDALRTGGLKIITRVLQRFIKHMPELPANEDQWDAEWTNAWSRFLSSAGMDEKDARPESDWERYWWDFRVFSNEPRHLIRSIRPSVRDVILGERLGTLAVDNAMAGYRGFMVSQWLTEFVLVPLSLVVMGRKRVPPDGIFWKSVRAKTRQPAGAGVRNGASA